MKDLYENNFKYLKKEVDDLRKWRDFPSLWIGRIEIVKMATLSMTIYRFKAILIKIPTQFFKDMERAILKFIWIGKKPKIMKTIINNKRTDEASTIPDVKLYYRAIVIKTEWHWYKDRHIDQWNKIEDPEI